MLEQFQLLQANYYSKLSKVSHFWSFIEISSGFQKYSSTNVFIWLNIFSLLSAFSTYRVIVFQDQIVAEDFTRILFLLQLLTIATVFCHMRELHTRTSLSISKCQCCPHIETSQLICTENQLTGFYMRTALAFRYPEVLEKL